MSKTNLVLLGIAVVQLVLVLFVGGGDKNGAPARAAGMGEAFFGSIDSANVGRVEVTDDDAAPIVVERIAGKDGKPDTFGLASKDGFPVRETELTSLVGTVNKMRRGRVVTTKPKSFTGLQVADDRFARHVVLKDNSGGTIADFYLGEGQKNDQVIFRKAGDTAAYNATGASTFEFSTSTSAWVETTFTDTVADDVVKVKLERESGTIELEKQERPKPTEPPKDGDQPADPPKDATKPTDPPKEGDKPADPPANGEKPADAPKEGDKPADPPKPVTEPVWVLLSPDGPKDLDKAKVETLVRGLSRLYLAEPVGKTVKDEYGLAKPTATATLTLKDGAVRTITVGAKRSKENDYYAQRSGFEYVVTLRSYSIDDTFLKKTDDLLPTKPGDPKKPDDDHSGHDHGDK